MTRKNRFKAILFDWNGTLNDMEPIKQQDIYVAKHRFNVEVTPEEVERLWGNPAQKLLPALFRRPTEEWEDLREIFWSYDHLFPRRLHRDVLPALRELKAGGFVLGSVTTGPRTRVLGYMRQAGLPLGDFEFIHTGDEINDDVAAGRPVLTKAVRRLGELGIRPDESLMVGDEPPDVRNARDVGADFVAVNRPASHVAPSRLIDAGVPRERIMRDLRLLPGMLDRIA